MNADLPCFYQYRLLTECVSFDDSDEGFVSFILVVFAAGSTFCWAILLFTGVSNSKFPLSTETTNQI